MTTKQMRTVDLRQITEIVKEEFTNYVAVIRPNYYTAKPEIAIRPTGDECKNYGKGLDETTAAAVATYHPGNSTLAFEIIGGPIGAYPNEEARSTLEKMATAVTKRLANNEQTSHISVEFISM